MSQRHLYIAGAIIAVLIIVSFLISVPHTTRDTTIEAVKDVPGIPAVTIRDGYKRGVHTIRGSFVASTACTTASTTAQVSGDESEPSIQIEITAATDTGICLQLPTTIQFSTTLSAPADLPIEVRVNGLVASTTLL